MFQLSMYIFKESRLKTAKSLYFEEFINVKDLTKLISVSNLLF
jgi:hypothetical protein